MREIKFRAWDKEDKRMITDTQEFIPLVVTNKGVFKLSPLHEENLYSILPIERFELMQYTGLKDKNGVEIYGGDIIQAGYYKWKCKVVWDEKCARFIGLTKDKDVSIVYIDMVDKNNESAVEVIGNIYDNPDLLEALHED